MSLFYRFAYSVGFKPWEHAATHPAAAEKIKALLDREGREREGAAGHALDLGCGTGIWAVDLARRGWDVTGIELVPAAVEAARERARDAGVDIRFIQGDITTLASAVGDAHFDFIWDFGTVHGLTEDQRSAVGRELAKVSSPDATMLMLAWTPARRGPLPRGMSRDEIEEAFREWAIVGEEPFDASGLPPPLRNVDPRVYRLRHARPSSE